MAHVSRSWPAERVPFEIWHRIFQELSLDGILVAMQVCWLWRAVAFETDAYSSDIVLDRQKRSAAELFLLRLRRTASRQPTLEISIDHPWELLGTLVMPAIGEHLSGIGALSLKCHSADAARVMERLRCPAPRLRRLRLAFVLDERSPSILPELPLDLLDNDAPNLRSLSLNNVDFLPNPMTRTLSSVVHLHMGYSSSTKEWYLASEHMWRYFPALSALTLSGTPYLILPAYCDPQSWRTIQQLHLDTDSTSATCLLRDLSFLRMLPIIGTCKPYESVMHAFLPHIPGPLDVALRPSTLGRSELCLTDRDTRITRVFTAPWVGNALALHLEMLLVVYNIRERMLSLTVLGSEEWLELAMFEIGAENLSTLRFVVPAGLDFAALGEKTIRYTCPSLASLVLRSESETPLMMSCDDVATFASEALDLPRDAEGRPRCGLVLENVTLFGHQELLDAHFRDIRHDDLSGWSYPFTPPPEA